MKANIVSLDLTNIGSGALGILALLLIFVVLTGRKVPLISGDREAFIALAIVGFSMCALALTPTPTKGTIDWLNGFSIIGTLLGIVATLLIFLVLTDRTLPLISGYHQAFIALAIIVATNWILTIVHALKS